MRALVPVAFQAGLDTVGEAMNDAEICAFVEKAIYEEIIPVLDLPRDELESFASAVTGRFRNPYIKHQLLSIALNGMTKFRTRILPQLLAGQKANGTLPARLTFALAALIAFYRGERNGETYPVQDDAHWLEPANRILLIMGEWLAVQRRNGQLSDILFISLNDRLNDISAVLAGCERIAYTPIPFAYTLILHRTVYLFCIMLPFALVVDLHYMTPFISVLISYTFISLDCLAEELEDPFGTENNDLPLDAICNAIEIDLLQMNDEAEIPAKILPDRHYQLT